jgi:hypothetical protein
MQAFGFFLLGIAAWLTAIFAPPIIALLFWHRASPRAPKWVAHMLFAPIVCAVEWVAVRLIFFAAHDDGSGPPGLGLALILPLLIFLGSIVTYYVVLAYCGARTIWLKANVR